MVTDSRTATASTKPRPSWRDRHLSQLTAEQLDELKQHRGDSPSVAQTQADTSEVYNTEPARTALPSQQPVVKRLAEKTGERPGEQAGHRRYSADIQHPAPPRYEDQNREVSRQGCHGKYQDEYQDMQVEPDRYHADDYPHERGYPEQAERTRSKVSSRYDDYRQADNRDRYRYTDESQRRHASDRAAVDAGQGNPAIESKGLVAKILDFKLPASIKFGLMALAIAVLVAASLLKPIDNSSQSQLDSAFVRASVGFALAKTLNGVISVAQGTEFAVQPAGVGVNFSPGEILDPVNDLVERFSWVMFVATSSIGIQKILLEVSSWTGISVLLAGAGLFFLLTRLRNSAVARLADIAGKLLLAILLVRFLVPVGSLANDWVFKQFLQPQYEASSAELEVASARIREISSRQTQTLDNDGSFTDRAKRLYSSVTSKFDFDGMLGDYKQSAETVSENAINLVAVFVLQTIIFPLLFMYLIYRLFRFVVLPPRALQ